MCTFWTSCVSFSGNQSLEHLWLAAVPLQLSLEMVGSVKGHGPVFSETCRSLAEDVLL